MESKYIDLRLAIGELVIAGHEVRLETHDAPSGNRTWLFDDTAHENLYCFRDGTGWKVKREVIQDWIDSAKVSN